ncbi:uncharacterized protein [Solanum lycopersicum]|uniref:uncharacterized protein isoform X1 n=1 Tax=Solanum lycopersicum TaxID=4081 RepID=UPI000532B4B5|nr:uncharacterized protein LOC101248327 isoform X1 [Solanum lycopersicum]
MKKAQLLEAQFPFPPTKHMSNEFHVYLWLLPFPLTHFLFAFNIPPNLQAMSLRPRIIQPHFCNDGCTKFRQHMFLAWSSINRVEINHCFTSHLHMQCCAVLADTTKIVSDNFRGNRSFDSKARTFKPFGQASHSLLLGRCQVRSEDSEGTLSGESILQNEETLARDLRTAIKEENYAQAAKIRDRLRLLQENSNASVLAANARFYNAFKTGDLAAMQALWSRGENTCIVHPGVSGISGYDLVMGSWEFVWAEYDFPLEIEIRDVQVHVRGDLGYVTCVEMVKTKGSSWGKQFATNVFEKVDGQWFICIHHASYIDL